ncbi:unnamed protein product [Lymnaea stagnalis]|uniref:Uncharacterized protein n=1 Tax=Lymnaea stagnalis TaxID=6523 RepID=A0AAV2I9D2_LYMST
MAVITCDPFYWCGLLGYGVGILFMIVGTGTTHWLIDSNGPGTGGLFWMCQSSDHCMSITSNDNESTVQALLISGIVVAALALAMALMFLLKTPSGAPRSKNLAHLSWVMAMVAGLLGIIGAGYYGVNIFSVIKMRLRPVTDIELGYSFALNLAGSILLFFSGMSIWTGASRIINGSLPHSQGLGFGSDANIMTISDARLGNTNGGYCYPPPHYSTVCQPYYPAEFDPKQVPPPTYDELQLQGTLPPAYSSQYVSQSLSPVTHASKREDVPQGQQPPPYHPPSHSRVELPPPPQYNPT